MSFLKRYWAAFIAVLAAIVGGMGLLVVGRRGNLPSEAHNAASDDVRDTENRGRELVDEALANGNAEVNRSELRYEESIDDAADESSVDVLRRLANRS